MFNLILLTIATGMRTMTGIAVVCWAAYLGYLPVEGTWAFWTAKLVSVIVFTVLAVGEYVGDTLPQTPSRRDWPLVLGRLFFAVLVGVIIATAMTQPKAGGVLVGIVGALIGIYGGYRVRMFGARLFKHDLPAALIESSLAVAFSVYAMAQIYSEVTSYVYPSLLRPY
jgi:uncharacterized membrane protein